MVTLSLVHPFRAFLIVLLLLVSFSSFAEEELKFEDKVLYRLQGRTLFLEDIKDYLSPLKSYICLFPDSQMFSLSGLTKDNLEVLGSLRPGSSDLANHRDILLSTMRHLQLQFHANSEGLNVALGFEQRLPLSQCGIEGNFDSWDRELRSLVQAELYYRENAPRPRAQRNRYVEEIAGKIESEVLF